MALTLGKYRALGRCSTADGKFAILALDHQRVAAGITLHPFFQRLGNIDIAKHAAKERLHLFGRVWQPIVVVI